MKSFVDLVCGIPHGEEGDRRLAAMLHRGSGHFDGLSTAEAERLRGEIYAVFEARGIPDDAMDQLIEELRTSASPLVLAGLARALRSVAADDRGFRTLLEDAIDRLALRDEFVGVGVKTCCSPPRTAREEIRATLSRWEAVPNPCCRGAPSASPSGAPRFGLARGMLASVEVEDQDGRRTSLLDELETRPVIVAFFYTRCMNPQKCSLTVTRLAEVAKLAEAGYAGRLSVLGVTYDPAFDAPERLAAYGRNRAFPFSGSARLLRAEKGWSSMRIGFDLQVGYGGATVNDHAREAFLISSGLLATPIDPEALARPEELVRRALEPSATT